MEEEEEEKRLHFDKMEAGPLPFSFFLPPEIFRIG